MQYRYVLAMFRKGPIVALHNIHEGVRTAHVSCMCLPDLKRGGKDENLPRTGGNGREGHKVGVRFFFLVFANQTLNARLLKDLG